MKLDVPSFRQEKSTTCGPACVRMVLAYNGIEQSEVQLENLCETSWLENTCEELASGSQELGLSAEGVENLTQDSLEDFLRDGIPLIEHSRDVFHAMLFIWWVQNLLLQYVAVVIFET